MTGSAERPERLYLRLSVTDRCNLRCLYCRPADASGQQGTAVATRDELLELVRQIDRVTPIDKLRLTGGEPLLVDRPDDLVRRIRTALPAARIGMTTNGVLLARYAKDLLQSGLQYLNISLDTLQPDRCDHLTRGGTIDPILAGIQAACETGFTDVKINCVLLRSINGDQLCELVRHAAKWRCELRFIELMPMGVGADIYDDQFLPAEEAHAQLAGTFDYLGPAPDTGTARRHRFRVDGRDISIGYITTVSHPFCDGCDRYRLDSRGSFFSCLRNEHGHDLLSPLRAGQHDFVRQRIQAGLAGKTVPLGLWPDRSMVKIGG